MENTSMFKDNISVETLYFSPNGNSPSQQVFCSRYASRVYPVALQRN